MGRLISSLGSRAGLAEGRAGLLTELERMGFSKFVMEKFSRLNQSSEVSI